MIPTCLIGYGTYLGLTSPDEKARVIRVAHSLNRDHPNHLALVFMAGDLHRRSGGAMRLEVYPDEQLGPQREVTEMLQFGGVAVTPVSASVLENFQPKLAVLSLPFLFRDRDHYWKVLDGPVGRELLESFQVRRLIGLCYFDSGARSFYINRKTDREIHRPEDLAGLKIRVMNSRTASQMMEALGAKPTPLSWGELYGALDQGAVDGAENNPPSLFTSRQYEVSSTYSLNEHTRIPDVLIMSLDTWSRLSGTERAWVRESAEATSRHQRELWTKAVQSSLAEIGKSGVKIIRDVDRDAFRERMKSVYEQQTPEVRELVRRVGETK